MWLIGAMVCLLAAPWVQLSVSTDHWLMPISCHFRDCKALLVTSLTDVSGAIAGVQTFTFTFTTSRVEDVHLCLMWMCRDGLISQSKSFEFCVTTLKSHLRLRHLYSSTESLSSVRSVTPTPLDSADISAADLLEHVLYIVRDCSDTVFVSFMDATLRHTCRPEHRWSAHVMFHVCA